MRIIALSGCPAALPTLKYLFSKDHLSALLCPKESTGIESLELEKWAHFHEIPCWQVTQQQVDEDLKELIEEVKPDLIITYGFPFSINGELLKDVKRGGWNVHYSLQPNQFARITIHQLAFGNQYGEIINDCSLALLPTTSGLTSIEQLSSIAVTLLRDSLRQFHYKKLIV